MEQDNQNKHVINDNSFNQLVLNIIGEQCGEDYGISIKALDILQSISEDKMIEMFNKSKNISEGKRNDITIRPNDIKEAVVYDDYNTENIESYTFDNYDEYNEFEEVVNSLKAKKNSLYKENKHMSM